MKRQRIFNAKALEEALQHYHDNESMQREMMRRAVREVMEPVIDIMSERVLQLLEVAGDKLANTNEKPTF